jgi:uncharacterized protein (DUF2236 family)
MTATDAPDLTAAKFGIADYAGEQAMLLGAGSTVMYQLAMKGVGLGVAEHSTTLRRPVDRLRTTLTYIYVMSWGTEAEKMAVSRMVNKMHAPVRSPGRYTAFDPDLQLWVAATLAKNGEWLFEKIFGPMDAATRERCYRESWIFGTALQVKPDMWPPTRAAFEEYWEESVTRLEPDPIVQEYVKQLLTPRGARRVPSAAEPDDPGQPRSAHPRDPGVAVDGARPAALRPVLEGVPAALPIGAAPAPADPGAADVLGHAPPDAQGQAGHLGP